MIKFLKEHKDQSGIIYCSMYYILIILYFLGTRKQVDELTQELTLNKFSVAPFHAGKKSKEKTEIQTKWLNNEIKIIIATIAFGMGIDKKGII